LAESKNASVVRKTFGYSHIEQHWADELNIFNRDHLIPFINYHRPCYFPAVITDDKGKQRKLQKRLIFRVGLIALFRLIC
jgi:hypothetical protein